MINLKLISSAAAAVVGAVKGVFTSDTSEKPCCDPEPSTIGGYEPNSEEFIMVFKNVIIDSRMIFYIERGSDDNAYIHFHDSEREPVATGETFDSLHAYYMGEE